MMRAPGKGRMKRKERSSSGPAASSQGMTLLRLRAIEHGIEANDLASVNALGELLPLLELLKKGQDDLAVQSLHALRRIFLVLIKRGDVRRPAKAGGDKPAKQRRTEGAGTAEEEATDGEAGGDQAGDALRMFERWVYEQYQAFVAALLNLIDEAPALRVKVASLRTLMELLKVDYHVCRKPQRCFGHDLFHRLVGRLVAAPAPGLHDELVEVLRVDYVAPFFDVRYWLLRSLRVLAERELQQGAKAAKVTKAAKAGEDGKQAKAARTRATAALFRLLMLVTAPATEIEMVSFLVPFVDDEEGKAQGAGAGASEARPDGDEEDDEDLDFDYGDDGEEDEDGLAGLDSAGDAQAPASAGKGERVPLVAQLSAHRKALGEAWVTCLRLELTPALYRSTTQFVARHVVDNMANPLQLSDFFTVSYAQGGLTSLVALEGLFVLMQQHNLEYPRFYASLYRLLSSQVMFSRHRPRFFRLLRLCLQSTHVPAHIVAAFVKKLCRLALMAPPPSIIFILSLVVVVLRRHPECQALIHRAGGKGKGKGQGQEEVDAFDPGADDPARALRGGGGGLQTSLWELAALQRHYLPAVATLAKGLETSAPEDPRSAGPFTAAGLDEFAAYSYAALFGQEAKKRRPGKGQAQAQAQDVPLAFEAPRRPGALFQPGDCFDGVFALAQASS